MIICFLTYLHINANFFLHLLKISDPIEDAFGDVTTPQKSEGIRAVSTSPDMILKTPKGNRGLQYGKTECRCGAANCRKYFF